MVLMVSSGTSAIADSHQYGWTISDSPTDPFSNTGAFLPTLQTLYLWFACSDVDGMAAAEFRLEPMNPANIILAFSPTNGYLNAGGPQDLLLAVGGCPTGPVVAGNILVLNTVPGEYCIVPSSVNGNMVTVDCSALPEVWPIQQIGFSNTGSAPSCNDELCPVPTPTQGTTWGRIKGLYR
jgi:hypothetical protein